MSDILNSMIKDTSIEVAEYVVGAIYVGPRIFVVDDLDSSSQPYLKAKKTMQRTKIRYLACRKRKKKCDERKPRYRPPPLVEALITN